jgi:hypothetical protein
VAAAAVTVHLLVESLAESAVWLSSSSSGYFSGAEIAAAQTSSTVTSIPIE